ncbi:MAG: hypothetical protein SCARUB_03154 [Candidatus Scalindua rubra]|uniref:Coenzyme PQQ synthesis protein D n=1 Tax=Candidatus Scalindua rubra TaxID=1872076 RepID=A0A1E3X7W1_9BACT|nr:MAG: hypothetical protein SCARUB_03154 [Candidatus Scalindua rubra]
MEINEDSIPSAKEGVKLEELDDGCVLYDTEKDEVHSLNITAASVWACCDGKHTIKEIADVIEKCFKQESKVVLQDIIKIIQEFSKKELIK